VVFPAIVLSFGRALVMWNIWFAGFFLVDSLSFLLKWLDSLTANRLWVSCL
jgi:hypothetical protein